MIGSPASRGAVASTGCAGFACFAAASAGGVSAISTAAAAKVTMAEGAHRRIASAERAVVNRFAMVVSIGISLRQQPVEHQVEVGVEIGLQIERLAVVEHHHPQID